MKRKIVLASHGGLAAGLHDTAKMIIGEIPYELAVYSLQPGSLAEDFVKNLGKEIAQEKDTEYVVMTDLYGASVFSAMYALVKFSNMKLFAGMNLNMLLSVCLEHPTELKQSDIEQILNDAKQGIQYAVLQNEEHEDF